MMEHYKRVYDAIQECLEKAKKAYGFSVPVFPDIRNIGRSGGKAVLRNNEYTLVINRQLITEEYIDQVCNEVIPHEIAHLVCFWNPRLGRNHDRGWQRVCMMLGGSGARTHNMATQKVRRTSKAVYNVNGRPLNVGIIQHRRIQSGQRSYYLPSNQAKILPEHFTGQIIKV